MKSICIFLITPWIALFAFGQDSTKAKNIDDIIYNLRKKVNYLNFKYNSSKTEDFKDNLSAGIYNLKSMLDDNYTNFLNVSDSNTAYVQSLLMNYKILEKQSISEQDIDDLNEDFTLKINSFNPGLYKNGSDGIPVTVTTYDSALHKISGYFVYWNSWVEKDNPQPYDHFDEFTNPSSSGVLVPGIYDIWVQKAGDKRRYPPTNKRTKNNIFLNTTEKSKNISIVVN